MSETDYTIIYFLARGWLKADPETGLVWFSRSRKWSDPNWAPLTDTTNGYLLYRTRHRGRKYSLYAHRIIWIACAGTPDEHVHAHTASYAIDHIDGDRMNNRITNLQLVTNRVNTQKGQCATLDPAKVLAIRHARFTDGASIDDLAQRYNAHRSTVLRVLNGQAWPNVGGPLDETLEGYQPRLIQPLAADTAENGIQAHLPAERRKYGFGGKTRYKA